MSTNLTDVDWEFVFFEWAFRHSAINSNAELAHLSNVCTKWRESLKRCIVEFVRRSNEVMGDQESLSFHQSDYKCIQLLLLPSMVYKLISNNTYEAPLSSNHNSYQNESSEIHKGQYAHRAVNETFCVAWFPSEGIQEINIDIQTSDDDETMELDEGSLLRNSAAPSSLCGGGSTAAAIQTPGFSGELYEGSEDERRSLYSRSSGKQRRRTHRSRSPPRRKNNTSIGNNAFLQSPKGMEIPAANVCPEWRGYRSAVDVLQNFGYSKSFVEEVLDLARENSIMSGTENGSRAEWNSDCYTKPTYAVPGATVARAERYCLCLDKQGNTTVQGSDDISRDPSSSILKSQDVSLSDDSGYGSSDDDDISSGRVAIRIEEYKQSMMRRERRKKCLQRDVIPRSLLLNTDVENQQRKCVQFLNASGSHAVCMVTPPFTCGPIPEPITIICIGIATEDGCFVSGLHHRFEFGHLYPSDEMTELAEMSPICISTEAWNQSTSDSKIDSEAQAPHTAPCSAIHSKLHSDCYQSSSCEESEDEVLSSKRVLCNCIFQDSIDKANESDDENTRFVHRGCLGPGLWHCYTAVVDGPNSHIRIDGIAEPMTHKNEFEGVHRNVSFGKAMLDGLTIGSDHCFGMSLCCGNGSGGEGEGAIAELVVFSGRLNAVDLCVLEDRLMEKHGIRSGFPSLFAPSEPRKPSMNADPSPGLLWQENAWERQARALLFTNSPLESCSQSNQSVPLRFFARHRSVAWRYYNPVTGERIRTTKIGCRPGAESSSDL